MSSKFSALHRALWPISPRRLRPAVLVTSIPSRTTRRSFGGSNQSTPPPTKKNQPSGNDRAKDKDAGGSHSVDEGKKTPSEPTSSSDSTSSPPASVQSTNRSSSDTASSLDTPTLKAEAASPSQPKTPPNIVSPPSQTSKITDISSSQQQPQQQPQQQKDKKPSHNTSSTLLKSRLGQLQSFLEDSSGLTALTVWKQTVQAASDHFDTATHQVSTARQALEEAQKTYDRIHQQHVALLMRRDEWTADDAQLFVSLTARDVATKQTLRDAQMDLHRSETQALQSQQRYMDVMRQRYHEEQLWQDKWRLWGTYGTWALIGLNSIVFGLTQYYHARRERERMHHLEQTVRNILIVGAGNNNNDSITDDAGQQQPPVPHGGDGDEVQSDQSLVLTNTTSKKKRTGTDPSNIAGSASASTFASSKDPKDSKPLSQTTTSTSSTESESSHSGEATVIDRWSERVRGYYRPYRQRLDEELHQLHRPSVVVGAAVGMTCGVVLSWSVSLLRRP